MNLIEQLGGYERAKHEFEMIKEMKPIYPGEIETNNRLLLEYRRQHNIFEVGDLVVFVDEKERKPVLLKFKESRNFDLVHLEVIGSGLCGPSYQKEIRHATDAEIKAGKRLEVNQ